MVHRAEFENAKCSSDEEEDDGSLHLAGLWSKSERKSGVKFDIQKDATKKMFQQPKDDVLTNCDTEHVTHNLVSTILHKSKSYLEAPKGKFSDTNKNQTFPTRPTLEQGFAINEGVPTAESPTALEVVPTTESTVTNKDVLTDEPPTEVVGLTAAESPTPQTSRDEQAIRRNARNPLVALGNMANEEDESQVNSLSPSNIYIQNSRRVNFSVDAGNKVTQSSTSVLSEGEALGNVVDVDPISRPHYEPIDMTDVGLRR